MALAIKQNLHQSDQCNKSYERNKTLSNKSNTHQEENPNAYVDHMAVSVGTATLEPMEEMGSGHPPDRPINIH